MMLRMKTPTEVRRALQKVANMVANGEIDCKQANTIIYAANSILNCIRIDEQEHRIEEIEDLLQSLERKKK